VAERETMADEESIVWESTFGGSDVVAAGSGRVVASVARDPGSSVPGWECSTGAEVECPMSEDPVSSVPGWECSTATEVEYSASPCDVTGDVELGCPVTVLSRLPVVKVECFVIGLSVTSVGSSVMVLFGSSSAVVLSTAVSIGEVVIAGADDPALLSSAEELT
jgi:hypothetical protein